MIIGKVEAGTLCKGDSIKLMPTGTVTRVDNLYSNEQAVRGVKPGDNVALRCSLNQEDICKGFVICGPTNQARAVTKFTCQLALVDLLETRSLFTAGYDCMLHIHTLETEVTVGKLLTIKDPQTGAEKRFPRFAKQGAQITCTLEVQQSIVCAPYAEQPQLGRFTLRDEGKSIAIGMVLKLESRRTPASRGNKSSSLS